jgi:hypothetical protein
VADVMRTDGATPVEAPAETMLEAGGKPGR